MRGIGHVRAKHGSVGRGISHDEHKPCTGISLCIVVAIGKQRAQACTVAIQTIGQTPGVDELEAGWDQQTDFLREGTRQQLLLKRRGMRVCLCSG